MILFIIMTTILIGCIAYGIIYTIQIDKEYKENEKNMSDVYKINEDKKELF